MPTLFDFLRDLYVEEYLVRYRLARLQGEPLYRAVLTAIRYLFR